MSQETLKTQERVRNDTISLILRVERSQPITQTVHKSRASFLCLARYSSHSNVINKGLFSRSKLQTNPEARALS